MMRIRRLIAVALLAAVALWAQVPRAAQALTVQGHVLKGDARTPVADQPVQLHVVRGEQEEPGATLKTNAKGEYRFDGIDPKPGLSFYVTTEFESAVYTEGPLAVGSVPSLTQDLIVFDVGSDQASIKVSNHHLIVESKPDGLHVTEILIFDNAGQTSYLGTGPNHAENAGVRIGLPASIKNFEPGMGADEPTTRVQGRELSSLRPIPPGVRPFSFTYLVPTSARMDLSHRLYFPTGTFVVMLDDPKLKVESKSLQSGGTRDQGGKQYAIYSGTGFTVGQEVDLRVGGASIWTNPRIYPWLLAPFLIAAAVWIANRRGNRAREVAHAMAQGAPPVHPAVKPPPALAPPPPAAPRATPIVERSQTEGAASEEDIRKVYVHLIAALDEGLQRGDYSRDAHALIRQNLKRRLQTVLSSGEPASGAR